MLAHESCNVREAPELCIFSVFLRTYKALSGSQEGMFLFGRNKYTPLNLYF